MYIIEFLILQTLLIIWLVYILKRAQPKKESPYSYKVFVGNIGAVIIGTVLLIWTLVNKQSFLIGLWKSITE